LRKTKKQTALWNCIHCFSGKKFPKRKEAAYTLIALYAHRKKEKNLLSRYIQLLEKPYPGLEDIYLHLKGNFFFNKKLYEKSKPFFIKLKDYKKSVFSKKALLKLGEISFLNENYKNAISYFQLFSKTFPKSRLNNKALWFLGKSKDKLGDKKKAIESFRKVVWNYPLSPYASKASKALKQKKKGLADEKGPNQLYKRAITFYKAKRYRSAEKDFKRFCKKYRNHPKIPQAILIRGKMAFNLRQNSKALELFSWLIRAFPKADERAEAMYTKAMVYWRIGRGKSFLKSAKKVNKKYFKKWGARILYTIGKFYEEKEDWNKALKQYESVEKLFKPQKYFHESMWSAAWSFFMLNKLEEAEKKMSIITTNFPQSPHLNNAIFWRGVILEKLEKEEEAIKTHKENVEKFPLTYLGHQSKNYLEKQGLKIPYKKKGLGKEEIKIIFSNIFISEAHKERIKILISNCFFKIAEQEVRRVTRKLPRKKRYKTMFEIAKISYMAEKYMSCINILRRYFIDKMVGIEKDCPTGFWRMSYPLAFPKELRKNALKYKISPYLIAAVIRAESAFNMEALSRTHAVGLMQIQPKTGRRLAKKIGIRRFLKKQLLTPEINIAMGSFYIRKLLNEFDGNAVYAIASYNAGEDRVHRWAKVNGHLKPIEFINTIPYKETRTYVKRVLGYFEEYKRIYQ